MAYQNNPGYAGNNYPANYNNGYAQGAYNNQPQMTQQPVRQQPAPRPAQVAPSGGTVGGGGGGGPGWQYGICGCCAKGTKLKNCCMGCWCPCIAEYRLALRLNESCLVPFLYLPQSSSCAACAQIQPEMSMSTRLRYLVGIQQSQLEEGCLWLWCGRCMLCRMMNEMDNRQIDWEFSMTR